MIQYTDMAFILQLDADAQTLVSALQALTAAPTPAIIAQAQSIQARLQHIVANETAVTIQNLQRDIAALKLRQAAKGG